ncbi:hypothetical protein AB0L05_16315 [Nonomuraea pusilla]|uniref:hypothetical protein n=1 Tax=Nonomuraea pusilla TaxID=46177 RepID=UPI003321362B
MSVVRLPGGVLRVPTVDVLDDGTTVHGTRDVPPDAPDYERWLPHAVSEEQAWHDGDHDEEILDRWGPAESA